MLRVDQAAATDAKMSFDRRKGLKRAVTIGLSQKVDIASEALPGDPLLVHEDGRDAGGHCQREGLGLAMNS